MELIKITHETLEEEHICCAISNNKDCQVASKKAWLKERLDEGLVFLKCNVRGKCFIEYIPAEYAWAPIEAEGYMYIDCLWVSGKFKGQGYSNLLLEECIKDSKANPYFELMYMPFEENNQKPRFKPSVKETKQENIQNGFTVYYTNQCPFTAMDIYLKKRYNECNK